MSDEPENSPASDDKESSPSELSESEIKPTDDNIQSLTDFFDQMDRAAFKRALANREAFRESVAVNKKRNQR